ncbi:hypothetical protein [Brevibacillus borstelensis]|uniref:hypothetical protein n=1 Tax=Brevibacillus borstelensis TaxID=45462 RepID=UPI00287F6B3E|nr:hypothetical protein [Brevibacillus borstelensis]WNF07496.1 hypothetical protein RFB14_08865 [Brevibacillus borstelensis]
MNDWKRKLSSRKLWLALAGFVASVLVLFGTDAGEIEKVTAMITALGSVVAYVVAEGYVDAHRSETE